MFAQAPPFLCLWHNFPLSYVFQIDQISKCAFFMLLLILTFFIRFGLFFRLISSFFRIYIVHFCISFHFKLQSLTLLILAMLYQFTVLSHFHSQIENVQSQFQYSIFRDWKMHIMLYFVLYSSDYSNMICYNFNKSLVDSILSEKLYHFCLTNNYWKEQTASVSEATAFVVCM